MRAPLLLVLALAPIFALPGAAEKRVADWIARLRAGGPDARALIL